MKKLLCFIMAAIIAFSAVGVTFASEESSKCDCGTAPVVYVRGFGGGIFKV